VRSAEARGRITIPRQDTSSWRAAASVRPRSMSAIVTTVELRVADGLQGLLQRAQTAQGVPQTVSEKAKQYSSQKTIPFRAAQEICVAVRAAHGGEGPWLYELAKGTPLQLPTPPERVKSKELQERLARLQKEQEKREYARMVADITKGEVAAEQRSNPSVNGYKEAVGFGLNTIVTSGVLFMLFYFTGKRLSPDKGMQLMYGILGLFLGIVMNSMLLLIRSYQADLRVASAAGRVARRTRPIGVSPHHPAPALDPQAKKTQ